MSAKFWAPSPRHFFGHFYQKNMCIFQTISNYFKLLDVYQNGLKLKHNDFDKSQFCNKMSSLNILWIFHGLKKIYIYIYFADRGLPLPSPRLWTPYWLLP